MKQIYTAHEMEIIMFDSEDVITTSIGNGGSHGDFKEIGDIVIN